MVFRCVWCVCVCVWCVCLWCVCLWCVCVCGVWYVFFMAHWSQTASLTVVGVSETISGQR